MMFHFAPHCSDKGVNFSLPSDAITTTKRQGCMFTDDGAVTVLSKISNNSSRGILTDGSKLRMERRLYTISEKSCLLQASYVSFFD